MSYLLSMFYSDQTVIGGVTYYFFSIRTYSSDFSDCVGFPSIQYGLGMGLLDGFAGAAAKIQLDVLLASLPMGFQAGREFPVYPSGSYTLTEDIYLLDVSSQVVITPTYLPVHKRYTHVLMSTVVMINADPDTILTDDYPFQPPEPGEEEDSKGGGVVIFPGATLWSGGGTWITVADGFYNSVNGDQWAQIRADLWSLWGSAANAEANAYLLTNGIYVPGEPDYLRTTDIHYVACPDAVRYGCSVYSNTYSVPGGYQTIYQVSMSFNVPVSPPVYTYGEGVTGYPLGGVVSVGGVVNGLSGVATPGGSWLTIGGSLLFVNGELLRILRRAI